MTTYFTNRLTNNMFFGQLLIVRKPIPELTDYYRARINNAVQLFTANKEHLIEVLNNEYGLTINPVPEYFEGIHETGITLENGDSILICEDYIKDKIDLFPNDDNFKSVVFAEYLILEIPNIDDFEETTY